MNRLSGRCHVQYVKTVVTCLFYLCLPFLSLEKSSTSVGWGKGRNVTSAGWQVTLCDPIWYVSSRSGDGRPACKLLYVTLPLPLEKS